MSTGIILIVCVFPSLASWFCVECCCELCDNGQVTIELNSDSFIDREI